MTNINFGGQSLSKAQLNAYMKQIDRNGDGKVTKDEIKQEQGIAKNMGASGKDLDQFCSTLLGNSATNFESLMKLAGKDPTSSDINKNSLTYGTTDGDIDKSDIGTVTKKVDDNAKGVPAVFTDTPNLKNILNAAGSSDGKTKKQQLQDLQTALDAEVNPDKYKGKLHSSLSGDQLRALGDLGKDPKKALQYVNDLLDDKNKALFNQLDGADDGGKADGTISMGDVDKFKDQVSTNKTAYNMATANTNEAVPAAKQPNNQFGKNTDGNLTGPDGKAIEQSGKKFPASSTSIVQDADGNQYIKDDKAHTLRDAQGNIIHYSDDGKTITAVNDIPNNGSQTKGGSWNKDNTVFTPDGKDGITVPADLNKPTKTDKTYTAPPTQVAPVDPAKDKDVTTTTTQNPDGTQTIVYKTKDKSTTIDLNKNGIKTKDTTVNLDSDGKPKDGTTTTWDDNGKFKSITAADGTKGGTPTDGKPPADLKDGDKGVYKTDVPDPNNKTSGNIQTLYKWNDDGSLTKTVTTLAKSAPTKVATSVIQPDGTTTTTTTNYDGGKAGTPTTADPVKGDKPSIPTDATPSNSADPKTPVKPTPTDSGAPTTDPGKPPKLDPGKGDGKGVNGADNFYAVSDANGVNDYVTNIVIRERKKAGLSTDAASIQEAIDNVGKQNHIDPNVVGNGQVLDLSTIYFKQAQAQQP